MKRILTCIAILCMLFTAAANAESADTLAAMYADAELLMVQGDYTGAASKFEAMGTYSDASQMAMYCKAVAAAETLGMFDVAVDAFTKLGDFKDSSQMAVYYLARGHEAAGAAVAISASTSDADLSAAETSYENAVQIYAELALFKDSLTRIAACQEQLSLLEAEQTDRAYQAALALERQEKYQEALELYNTIRGYKDADERAATCRDLIAAEQAEAAYQAALALERQEKYQDAIAAFEALNGYRDSAEHIEKCRNAILDKTYQQAFSLERERNYGEAAEVYSEISGYKDSSERATRCRNRFNYQKARDCEIKGRYDEAARLYQSLGDYRDSAERTQICLILDPMAVFITGNSNRVNDTQKAEEAILYFRENRETFPLVGPEEADVLAGKDWYKIELTSGYGYRFLFHFEKEMYQQIGAILNFRYSADTYTEESYQISANGILTGFYYDYQMRKLCDGYYVLYVSNGAGEYFLPDYLLCRASVNGEVISVVQPNESNSMKEFEQTSQLTLSFAAKRNDTLETWLASEEYMAMLSAALLVESGDYVDFADYGRISETYLAVYNQQMYTILIGMRDYTIMFNYIPDNDILMCQKIDQLVLTPEHADSMLAGFNNGEYAHISADVWYQLFDSVGESDEAIREKWLSDADAVYLPEGLKQFDFSVYATEEAEIPTAQEYDETSVLGVWYLTKNPQGVFMYFYEDGTTVAGATDRSAGFATSSHNWVQDGNTITVESANIKATYHLTRVCGEPALQQTEDPGVIFIRSLKKAASFDPLLEYNDKSIVMEVQSALNEAGYDCGKPDGIAGKGTAAAVTQYQTDKGLNVTGTITYELLISLGVTADS